VSSTHHPAPSLLLCAVEVDPHGDRKLTFKVEKAPVRVLEDSDVYKHYLHNKAIHAALAERGHVKNDHGDYPGSFASDGPRVPGLPLTAKNVGKALGYKEDDAPLFPFGNTLKVTRSCRVATLRAACDSLPLSAGHG